MPSDDPIRSHPDRTVPGAHRLEIRLLGSFEWRIDGVPLPHLRSRTEQYLLTLLLLRAPQSVERTWLAALFWPDSHEAQALNNLRRSLSTLRRALGSEANRLISPTPRTVAFDPTEMICDVIAFDAAIKRGDASSLQEALTFYRGPLLPDCDAFWLLPERQAREVAHLNALETLAARSFQSGRLDTALSCLQQALAIDPYRESAFRLFLETLHAYGDQAGMAQAYRRFRLLLHEQLQTAPDQETTLLYQRLQSVGREQDTATERSLPGRERTSEQTIRRSPRHLPVPLSPLIGRESERAEVVGLLASARLVTLTGVGGIGKTRLALAIAEQIADTFPDGVWFVDLAPISPPHTLWEAVAKALKIPAGTDQTRQECVLEFLAERRLLLLLDNCEHLLEPCASLAVTLLQQAPGLRILATSRRRLGVTGEQTWRVPSLRFAAPSNASLDAMMEIVREHEGPRLFVARAMAAASNFTPTPRNAAAILQICARLDGIPLALELAAARVSVLSVQQIALRLEDAFRLLKTGDRTALPRHRTLQALVDWSYALLTEPEQRAFRRLSCFVGRWTLEAAEALLDGDALDSLTALIDQSLLTLEVGDGGETRYRMLETLRQYGQERLRANGEWEQARARHRDYYAQFARTQAPRLDDQERSQAMALLAADYDNLSLALEGCLAEMALSPETGADLTDRTSALSPARAGLQIVSALWRIWEAHGNATEGRARLAVLLAHPDTQGATQIRAAALNAAGLLALRQSDYVEAYALFEQSLCLYQEFNDLRGAATVVGNMAIIRSRQGDAEATCTLLTQSLTLHRAGGSTWGIALTLGNLGALARRQGDYARSRTLLEESLTLRREIGDREGMAHALGNLGALMYAQADYFAARRFQEEKLALSRTLGNKTDVADSLGDLSQVVQDQGDSTTARLLLEESLALRREIGDQWGIALALGNLGGILLEQGDYVTARMLQEESLALRRRLKDTAGIAVSLANLGDQAHFEGDYPHARALHTESLSLFRALGHKGSMAHLLWNLGMDCHALNLLSETQSYLSECLELCQEIGSRSVALGALEGFARLALTQKLPERAACLYGHTTALRKTLALPRSSREQQQFDQAFAELRTMLSESELTTAFSRGEELSMEQVLLLLPTF